MDILGQIGIVLFGALIIGFIYLINMLSRDIKDQKKDVAELRKELIAMLEKEGYPVKSYPPSQIIPEGVAEFTRNYIMKPNFPTTIAPKFTILFENLMSSNDVFNRFIRSPLYSTNRVLLVLFACSDIVAQTTFDGS